MLLVGYNDDYCVPGHNKGGFIVQNSWGNILGHSLPYFMGEISHRNEQYMCPNFHNPREWVPINFNDDIYKLRTPTVLSLAGEEGAYGVRWGHFHIGDI